MFPKLCVVLAILSCFAISSCVAQTAHVKFVNVLTETQKALDFYVGSKKVTTLAFGKYSQWTNVEATNQNFKIALKGSPSPIMQGTFTLTADTNYTLNAVGSPSSGTFLLITLPTGSISPGSGSTFVGFANLAPSSPPLNLVVGGTTLFSGISYQNLGNPFQVLFSQQTQGSLTTSSGSTYASNVTIDLTPYSNGLVLLYAAGTSSDATIVTVPCSN